MSIEQQIEQHHQTENDDLKKIQITEELSIMIPMTIIKNGCPLCENDIKGNEKYKFYCINCKMFFKRIVHN